MKTFNGKRKKFIIFGSVITILILVIACNSTANKVEEAKENVTEARQDLLDAEEKYAVELIEMRIDAKNKALENEKTIQEIKLKIEQGDSTKRSSLQAKIKDLEVKNEMLKRKISVYQIDKTDDWTQFKANFKRDMDELGRSLNGFTSEPKQ